MMHEVHVAAWRSTAAGFTAELAPGDGCEDQAAVVAIDMARQLITNIPMEILEDTGLFLGMPSGSAAADLQFQRSRRADAGKFPSPAAFSRTLPSTLNARLALALGLRGPGLVFCAGPASGALAIARASQWIAAGIMQTCIAGVVDDLALLEDSRAPSAFVCLLAAATPGAPGLKLTAQIDSQVGPAAPHGAAASTPAPPSGEIAALTRAMAAAEKLPQTLTVQAAGIGVTLRIMQ